MATEDTGKAVLNTAEGEALAGDAEPATEEGGSPEEPQEEKDSAVSEGEEETEEKAKDEECKQEEKELDKAQEKIKQAQEEINKLQIHKEVAEAKELEKRAHAIAQTEAEEAEDEKLAGEQ